MGKKEIYKLVAYEYMKQFWGECKLYDALKPFGIYVNIEGSSQEAYLEKILDTIGENFVEELLYCQSYKDIDELIEEYFEDIEE